VIGEDERRRTGVDGDAVALLAVDESTPTRWGVGARENDRIRHVACVDLLRCAVPDVDQTAVHATGRRVWQRDRIEAPLDWCTELEGRVIPDPGLDLERIDRDLPESGRPERRRDAFCRTMLAVTPRHATLQGGEIREE